MCTDFHKRRWSGIAPDGGRKPQRLTKHHAEAYWTNKVAVFWLTILVMACLGTVAQTQERPAGGTPSQKQPPTHAPRQVLPPLPPSPPGASRQLPMARVFVREIRVTGNTAFSDAELAQVIAPYVGRELTTEELEALRLTLTRLYVNRGYLNSGVIIPDQTVSEGVITLHVIEGELGRIEVQGNRWFRSDYIRKRLALGIEPPLNIGTLQERLQLLRQDARIEQLNAELRPFLQRCREHTH